MNYITKIATLILCLILSPKLGQAADAGVYPDTGCSDGICCLILPDWEAGYYDAGIIDTGRRRRVVETFDAGEETPDEFSGCSISGASSLLWLLPLSAIRRRKRYLFKKGLTEETS